MVRTTYETNIAPMNATNKVKVTSNPVSVPSTIARKRAATAIPKRNPSVIPTAIIIKTLFLIAPACGRPIAPKQRRDNRFLPLTPTG